MLEIRREQDDVQNPSVNKTFEFLTGIRFRSLLLKTQHIKVGISCGVNVHPVALQRKYF